eukprot:1652082-Lingulodinium_polyedra.AAC.1
MAATAATAAPVVVPKDAPPRATPVAGRGSGGRAVSDRCGNGAGVLGRVPPHRCAACFAVPAY